jgi:predicted ABC-type sugar transport system permease subunit
MTWVAAGASISAGQFSMASPQIPAAAGRSILVRIAELRAWLFLILLIGFFETWSRSAYGVSFILNPYNLQSISVFATAPLILALGQTFVIISAGIDLSLGFVMGLASVIAAHMANYAAAQLGFGPLPAMMFGILAGVATTLIPGFVNGWLIAFLKVPPFIGTLGMFGVARGSAYLFAGGMTISVSNPWYSTIGNGRVLGVPVLVILAGVACLVMHYLLSQTRFGQHTYAMGASKAAASRAGINVKMLTMKIYLLAAVMAGIGGALYTGRFSAGAAQAGEPMLLDSIAAVVIGGASLFGGSGTIWGTIAGALVIAVIQYGLVFINVEPFWQFIAVGTVIIISVLVDQTQRRFMGGRQVE